VLKPRPLIIMVEKLLIPPFGILATVPKSQKRYYEVFNADEPSSSIY